jgi:hypothetical protein
MSEQVALRQHHFRCPPRICFVTLVRALGSSLQSLGFLLSSPHKASAVTILLSLAMQALIGPRKKHRKDCF